MTEKAPIAAYVPDLMDRSRFGSLHVDFVGTPEDLVAHDAQVVVLDLGRTGAIEALTALAGRRVVGFASHVDTELHEAARAAGCSEVLPRSRFFSKLGQILGQTAG